jgi:hypothetical protein
MARGRLIFVMPAPSAEAFEAFFNHSVRLQWDTLLKVDYASAEMLEPSGPFALWAASMRFFE